MAGSCIINVPKIVSGTAWHGYTNYASQLTSMVLASEQAGKMVPSP